MYYRYTWRTLVREVAVTLFALLWLTPLFLVVTTALKSNADFSTSSGLALPRALSFDSFVSVFKVGGGTQVVKGLLNSIVITAGSVGLMVILGSVTAYVLVRSTSRLSTVVFYLLLAGMLVPSQMGIIVLYSMWRSAGLLSSQIGLILLYAGMLLPLSIFLYAGFVRRIPREYEEAAVIDGASRWQTFFRVIFPMLSPATGTVAIMVGLFVWNDFFTPLIFVNGSSAEPLSLAIYSYVSGVNTEWNQAFAVIIVGMIPILIAYIFAQKRFIHGFSGGIRG